MEKELELMMCIDKKEHITQRELAETIGVSLGNINIMLKKMINSGFVHIEKFNSKDVRYMLTPLGINEKNKKTYDYVTESCNTMGNVLKRLKILLINQYKDIENIYFYGENDNLYPMIVYFCDELNKSKKCRIISNLGELELPLQSLIFIWNEEKEESLDKEKVNVINLLDFM